MLNLYREFRRLIADPALQVGTVTAIADGVATVQLPGGGSLNARGQVTVGQQVFVRNGAIEGPAPTLPVVLIEV